MNSKNLPKNNKKTRANPSIASEYPMRINKYLARQKYTTRKGADMLIKKKSVRINGRTAILGDKVEQDDDVQVLQNRKPTEYVYYAYNKPLGIITHSPQHGEKDIKRSVALLKNVFPVGRLDKNSHGLMILTNDGRITDLILNPLYAHEKEYLVTTQTKLRSNFKEKMEAGVTLEDYTTKPCTVKIITDTMFRIILTEGKKHQIRRMCSALFTEVKDLKRIRVMNITLGDIPSGEYRPIKTEELAAFKASLGLQ